MIQKTGSFIGQVADFSSLLFIALLCSISLTGCNPLSKTSEGFETKESDNSNQPTASAILSISDAPDYNFSPSFATGIGSSASKTFTVTNSGKGPAIIPLGLSSSLLGLSAPFSLTGGTCINIGILAAGSSCSLIVTFTPTVVGTATYTFTYSGQSSKESFTLSLSGTGANIATLTFDPTSEAFGSVIVGASSSRTLTISNDTIVAATDVYVSVSTPGYSLGVGCGTLGAKITLAAGASCTVSLTYTPGTAVSSSGSVSLSYHDSNSAHTDTLSFSGTGITPASLAISDGPIYDFQSVVKTVTATKIFTVTNSGQSSASFSTINDLNLGLAAPFSYVAGGLGSCTSSGTLASGGSCTLAVSFTPSAASGSSDTVSLSYNDGVSAQSATRDIMGTGIEKAILTFTPATHDFGNITVGNTSSAQSFTITNTGSATAANVFVVPSSGTHFALPSVSNNCGTSGSRITLAASATCTFTATFGPTSAGIHANTLTVTYDDGATLATTATASIGGTGVAAAVLTISDGGTYTYPNTAVSSSASKTFTVSNAASAATATLGTVSTAALGLGAPFTLTGGTCSTGGSIAGAGSCTIIVQFAPTLATTSTATISLDYNNGAAAQSTTRALSGTVLTCTDPTYIALDWTQAFTAGYYNSLSVAPSASLICSSTTLFGTPGSATCATGSADAVAANILATKTAWSDTGVLLTGTMPNHGAFDVSQIFSTPGYVSSLTGLTKASICSDTNFLGQAGEATCNTTSIGSINVTGTLSWGSTTSLAQKTIAISASGSDPTFARVSFAGAGANGFKIVSVAGTAVNLPASSYTSVTIGLISTSPSQASADIVIEPLYVDGTTKTMTVTITQPSGPTTTIAADVAMTDPILGIGNLLVRFKATDAAVTSIATVGGATLCTWPNSSGSGTSFDATNTTGTSCPRAVSGIFDGGTVPSVRFFDGTARWLDIQTLSLSRPYSAVVVFKYRGVLSGRTLASRSINWLAGTYMGAVANFYNHESRGWVGTSTPTTANTLYSTIAIDNGTNSYFYVNGTDRTNGTIGTSVSPGLLSIGGKGAYNEWADSDVAEIIIFSKALNSSERSTIETYVSQTY
jgi:hypothetical protein